MERSGYTDHRDIIFGAIQAYSAAVRETCKQWENIRGKVATEDHYAHIRAVEAQESAVLEELLYVINQAINDTNHALNDAVQALEEANLRIKTIDGLGPKAGE